MEIKDRIREFIVANCLFGDTSTELNDDTALLDTGIIDSTGVIELVLFISEEFGLEIPAEDMLPNNFNSINRLSDYVQQRILVTAQE
ncbi:MAG: acyl carrier protein [Chloroflexales bacterium]